MYLIYRLLIRHFIFIFLILPFTTRAIFDLDMVANDLVINNLPVNDFSANELDTNNFPADNIGTDYCLNDPDGCFSENQFMNDVSLKNDDFANSLFAADPIVDDVQSCRQPSRKLKDRGVAGGRFCANTEDLDLPSDTFVTRKDLITFWCPALLNSAPGIWPVCNRSVVTGDNYYPIIEAYLCQSCVTPFSSTKDLCAELVEI